MDFLGGGKSTLIDFHVEWPMECKICPVVFVPNIMNVLFFDPMAGLEGAHTPYHHAIIRRRREGRRIIRSSLAGI